MVAVAGHLRRILAAVGAALVLTSFPTVAEAVPRSAPPETTAPAADPSGAFTLGLIDVAAYPTITIDGVVTGAAALGPLDAESLVVIENGAERPLDAAGPLGPRRPLEVMIAFDRSGSMRPYLDAAVEAMTGLVNRLPAGTRVGLVSFSGRVTLDQGLTDDRSLVVDALEAIRADGNTAMYDAIVLAAEQFGDDAERRIVLLSDGGDNASDTTLDQAIEARSGIGVEIIELVTPESRRAILQQIADDGQVRSFLEPTELQTDSFEIISDDVVSGLATPVRLAYTSVAETEVIEVRVGLAGQPLGSLATVEILAPVAPSTTAPATTTTVPASSTTTTTVVTTTTEVAIVDAASSWTWPAATPYVAGFAVIAGLVALLAGLSPGRRGRRRRQLTPRLGPAGEQVLQSDGAGRFGQLLSPERQEAISQELRAAGIASPPGRFVVLIALSSIVVGLILGAVIGPLGFIGLLTPWVVMRRVRSRIKKRRDAFIAQLPDSLQVMSAMLRSGYGILQALDSLAAESDEPTGEWLERVLVEVRTGRELSEALRNLGRQVDSLDFDWVVVAIELNQEIGGDLSDTFDTIAQTIRDREKLRGQVQALTAEGRVSAYVMLILPPGLTLFMFVSNREFAKLINEPVGLLLLGIAGALMLAGFAWINHMVNKVAG